jgi:hypothetical protein
MTHKQTTAMSIMMTTTPNTTTNTNTNANGTTGGTPVVPMVQALAEHIEQLRDHHPNLKVQKTLHQLWLPQQAQASISSERRPRCASWRAASALAVGYTYKSNPSLPRQGNGST